MTSGKGETGERGSEIRDTRCGMRDTRYEIRDAGYGMWEPEV